MGKCDEWVSELDPNVVNGGPLVSEMQRNDLCAPITDSEIEMALKPLWFFIRFLQSYLGSGGGRTLK